jgi:hypothetical protein
VVLTKVEKFQENQEEKEVWLEVNLAKTESIKNALIIL